MGFGQPRASRTCDGEVGLQISLSLLISPHLRVRTCAWIMDARLGKASEAHAVT